MRSIRLSAVECRVILSALLSALAGCPSVGELAHQVAPCLLRGMSSRERMDR